MPSIRPKKSTIVRTKTQALRVGFRIAEVTVPSLGARVATRLWFTIPLTPRVAALPADGTSFEVIAQGSVVRGVSYGAGPVVYLMHGWGGVGAQLGSFIEPLRSNGFRVVLFDAPGTRSIGSRSVRTRSQPRPGIQPGAGRSRGQVRARPRRDRPFDGCCAGPARSGARRPRRRAVGVPLTDARPGDVFRQVRRTTWHRTAGPAPR